MGLIGRTLGAAQAEDNLRTALACDPWTANVLLEVLSHPERIAVYAEAASVVLPAAVEAELARPEPGFATVLKALKYASVFAPPTFETLLTRCAERFVMTEAADPSTARGAVMAVLRAHREVRAHPPAREGRLRIAVCVSGQLRGFRHAVASWAALRLHDHDTRYFVHTWRTIGGSPPHPANAVRLLDRRVAAAYTALVRDVGHDELHRRYPTMMRRLEVHTCAEADADEVRDVYGAEEVCVEDDREEPFAGKSNAWKMHDKIAKAHRLALSSGVAFDLFIRIRPDLNITCLRRPDWRALAHRCAAENLVLADEGRSIQNFLGYYMGDQFAVGAREGMDAYAGTFGFVEAGGGVRRLAPTPAARKPGACHLPPGGPGGNRLVDPLRRAARPLACQFGRGRGAAESGYRLQARR